MCSQTVLQHRVDKCIQDQDSVLAKPGCCPPSLIGTVDTPNDGVEITQVLIEIRLPELSDILMENDCLGQTPALGDPDVEELGALACKLQPVPT